MKKEYDFSNAIRNPYIDENLDKEITITLSDKTMDYFKEIAEKKGISYQALINIFLNDCADKKLDIAVVSSEK